MSKSLTPRKVNYRIADQEVDNLACIEVLEEKFKGVMFHFGRVAMGEDESVMFEYTIDEGDDSLEQSDEFKEIAACILYDLVTGKPNEN